jgi:hypothetical protein
MSPATAWQELSVAGAAFQEGFPDYSYDASTDYFIDVLFETTNFFAMLPTTGTELTLAVATPSTELTTPSTAYTELTL